MCIYMAGVDVHSADVSERERFAFSEEQVRHILQELVQKDGISGAVLLAPAALCRFFGRTAAHPGANRTGRSAAPHGGCLRSAFPDPA